MRASYTVITFAHVILVMLCQDCNLPVTPNHKSPVNQAYSVETLNTIILDYEHM